MTTIGGVVLRILDRAPVIDDTVSIDGIVLKVIELDGHRISRLRVSRGEPVSDEGDQKDQLNEPDASNKSQQDREGN
jgi:CBS domain containing-hemolysin-like protein